MMDWFFENTTATVLLILASLVGLFTFAVQTYRSWRNESFTSWKYLAPMSMSFGILVLTISTCVMAYSPLHNQSTCQTNGIFSYVALIIAAVTSSNAFVNQALQASNSLLLQGYRQHMSWFHIMAVLLLLIVIVCFAQGMYPREAFWQEGDWCFWNMSKPVVIIGVIPLFGSLFVIMFTCVVLSLLSDNRRTAFFSIHTLFWTAYAILLVIILAIIYHIQTHLPASTKTHVVLVAIVLLFLNLLNVYVVIIKDNFTKSRLVLKGEGTTKKLEAKAVLDELDGKRSSLIKKQKQSKLQASSISIAIENNRDESHLGMDDNETGGTKFTFRAATSGMFRMPSVVRNNPRHKKGSSRMNATQNENVLATPTQRQSRLPVPVLQTFPSTSTLYKSDTESIYDIEVDNGDDEEDGVLSGIGKSSMSGFVEDTRHLQLMDNQDPRFKRTQRVCQSGVRKSVMLRHGGESQTDALSPSPNRRISNGSSVLYNGSVHSQNSSALSSMQSSMTGLNYQYSRLRTGSSNNLPENRRHALSPLTPSYPADSDSSKVILGRENSRHLVIVKGNSKRASYERSNCASSIDQSKPRSSNLRKLSYCESNDSCVVQSHEHCYHDARVSPQLSSMVIIEEESDSTLHTLTREEYAEALRAMGHLDAYLHDQGSSDYEYNEEAIYDNSVMKCDSDCDGEDLDSLTYDNAMCAYQQGRKQRFRPPATNQFAIDTDDALSYVSSGIDTDKKATSPRVVHEHIRYPLNKHNHGGGDNTDADDDDMDSKMYDNAVSCKARKSSRTEYLSSPAPVSGKTPANEKLYAIPLKQIHSREDVILAININDDPVIAQRDRSSANNLRNARSDHNQRTCESSASMRVDEDNYSTISAVSTSSSISPTESVNAPLTAFASSNHNGRCISSNVNMHSKYSVENACKQNGSNASPPVIQAVNLYESMYMDPRDLKPPQKLYEDFSLDILDDEDDRGIMGEGDGGNIHEITFQQPTQPINIRHRQATELIDTNGILTMETR
eukprot:m.112256 g.112256  ORF g.112256 m.112256 type:complete len:1010 (+) comp9250_c0_seq2:340-3369(+)